MMHGVWDVGISWVMADNVREDLCAWKGVSGIKKIYDLLDKEE